MSDSMFQLCFEQFKRIYDAVKHEAEFRICFDDHDNEYMIIKYENKVSFQRCGVSNGSGELIFDSLDSLYIERTIDNICLNADWTKITSIIMDDFFDLCDKSDFVQLCEEYQIIE